MVEKMYITRDADGEIVESLTQWTNSQILRVVPVVIFFHAKNEQREKPVSFGVREDAAGGYEIGFRV